MGLQWTTPTKRCILFISAFILNFCFAEQYGIIFLLFYSLI